MVLRTITYKTSKVTILTERENKQKISKQKTSRQWELKLEKVSFLVNKHLTQLLADKIKSVLH